MYNESEINEIIADAMVSVECWAVETTERYRRYSGKSNVRVFTDVEACFAWTAQNDAARYMSDMGW